MSKLLMNIDLQAFRCPTAQVHLNRLLDKFLNSDADEMTITTIEPSLGRSLAERIVILGLPFVLSGHVSETPITDDHIKIWSGYFDEEDFSDVSIRKTYQLTRSTASGERDQTAECPKG